VLLYHCQAVPKNKGLVFVEIYAFDRTELSGISLLGYKDGEKNNTYSKLLGKQHEIIKVGDLFQKGDLSHCHDAIDK
jgi:hypothetical protein